jgi:hypothetical protein
MALAAAIIPKRETTKWCETKSISEIEGCVPSVDPWLSKLST